MHYEGEDARNIEAFTAATVKAVLLTDLALRGRTIGENDLVFLESAVSAKKRLEEGRPFVLMIREPTISTRRRVRVADGTAHSGCRYDWAFLLQLSESTVDGKRTNEQIVAADKGLADLVRSIFLERYGYFRGIGFYDLRVSPRDDSTDRTQQLNPLALRFYNVIRLPEDTFLTV